jgi:hypothetical protein
MPFPLMQPPRNHYNGLIDLPFPGTMGYIFIDYEPTIATVADANAFVVDGLAYLTAARAVAPLAKYGFFGIPPGLNAAIDDAFAPLLAQCDFILPQLYNYEPSTDSGFNSYAAAHITESRRVAPGKPVYPFIYPQYSSAGGYAFISAAQWTAQLLYLATISDGLVIWGGYTLNSPHNPPMEWDPNAPWWLATQALLPITPPPPPPPPPPLGITALTQPTRITISTDEWKPEPQNVYFSW